MASTGGRLVNRIAMRTSNRLGKKESLLSDGGGRKGGATTLYGAKARLHNWLIKAQTSSGIPSSKGSFKMKEANSGALSCSTFSCC